MRIFVALFCLINYSQLVFGQENIYTLVGHEGNVNTVAYSPDGTYLLSGSQDSKIKFWSLASNYSNVRTLEPSTSSITGIQFSKDGKEFMFSTFKSFHIYQYPELKRIGSQKNGHTTFVTSAKYSSDDKMIVSSSWRDNTLIVWYREGIKKNKVFFETEWTDNAIFLDSNKSIASANHANTIKVWDIESGNIIKTFAGHTDWVYGIILSSDSAYLISGSLDKTIKIWDIKTGKIYKTIEAHEQGITGLYKSPTGNYFASTSLDKTVKIWSMHTFEEVGHLIGHEGSTLCAAFSNNETQLATSSSDKTIKIWDIRGLLKK